MSSADQRADLERQAGRVAIECGMCGITLAATVTEGNVTTIVVEYRDWLARFGVEHLEAALSASGRRVVVLDPRGVRDDLVSDTVEVLTSMCVRVYGRRCARKRVKAGVRAVEVGG